MKTISRLPAFFAIFAILSLVACTEMDNGVSGRNVNKTLKSETKWLVNNSTNERILIVNHNEYDSEGRVTLSDEYTSSGVLVKSATTSYEGVTSAEEVKYYTNAGVLDSSCTNLSKYNELGKVVEKSTSDDRGNVLAVATYEYDNKGNVVQNTYLDGEGKVSKVIKYEYNYNSSGNLVERIQFSSLAVGYVTKDSLVYNVEKMRIDKLEINSEGETEVVYTFLYNYFGFVSMEIQKNSLGNIIKAYEYEYTYYN